VQCVQVISWRTYTVKPEGEDSKDGNGKQVNRALFGYILIRPKSRLFIVDGAISLPIALLGYFFYPDVPEIAKPFYLTKDVRKLISYAVTFLY
jgi:hypothetical protein